MFSSSSILQAPPQDALCDDTSSTIVARLLMSMTLEPWGMSLDSLQGGVAVFATDCSVAFFHLDSIAVLHCCLRFLLTKWAISASAKRP